MNLYFFSYDLKQPESNYEKLNEFLESLGALRMTESNWCFESDESIRILQNKFKNIFNGDDGFILSICLFWVAHNLESNPGKLI